MYLLLKLQFYSYFLFALSHGSEVFFISQQLSEIPDVGKQIPIDTTSLILSRNNIEYTSADDFKGLQILRKLDLDRNSLSTFPNFTHVSGTLEELNLAHNSITEILDAELDILHQLSYLRLDSNQLTTLPDSYGPSQTLHTILLSGNLIEDFPSFNKLGKSLIRLDLQYNNLQRMLTENIKGLESIKYLILVGNQLSVFPDVTDLSDTLVMLDLSDNLIGDVPESHFLFAGGRQALVINLETNQLTSLPSPGCVPNNVLIKLQGNPLHCDSGLAWLLTTTGIRVKFYDYLYQDYDYSENQPEYYNTLEYATCNTPSALAGRSLSNLTYTDLGITPGPGVVPSQESMSATKGTDVYMLGMPLSRVQVLNRVECQAVCMDSPGCRFYNLRAVVGGESSLCDYSDPLHGSLSEVQPDGGTGWTAYSLN